MALNWKGWELFSKKEETVNKRTPRVDYTHMPTTLQDKYDAMKQNHLLEASRQQEMLRQARINAGQYVRTTPMTTPNGHPAGMVTSTPGSLSSMLSGGTPSTFNQPLGQWNASMATNMQGMFAGTANMPWNPNEMTDDEKAAYITNFLIREGLTDVSTTVLSKVKIALMNKVIGNKPAKKQPKKKLDL